MAEVVEVKAIARNLPVPPQKSRLVVDAVRGMKAQDALSALMVIPNKSAEFVYKLVASAMANAEQNFELEVDDLFIQRIFADEGPTTNQRPYGGRFGARGRFKPIINRTSHITVVLAERNPVAYEAKG